MYMGVRFTYTEINTWDWLLKNQTYMYIKMNTWDWLTLHSNKYMVLINLHRNKYMELKSNQHKNI